MSMKLPQFFEDTDEGVVTFDLSFLQRVGSARLLAGASTTVEFEIEAGEAGYIVEQGNSPSFQNGPGRSALRLARERQMTIELSAQIVRGAPKLTLYIIQYNSDGSRLRQLSLRHAQGRIHGSLTLTRDVASYMIAIRLAGRGAVEFGEFRTRLEASDLGPDGSPAVAIAGSTPETRLSGISFVTRLAGQVGKLDRRRLEKGVDLTRRGARRLTSRVAALAKSTGRRTKIAAHSDNRADLIAMKSRSQLRLRKLNDELDIRGRTDPAMWLSDALNFAVSMESYETAERLSRYALAIWPDIDASHREAMLVSLVEALTAVGDTGAARRLLETNTAAVLLNDKLTTHARLLGVAPCREPADFLLPSGKLDAFSLSRAENDASTTIKALYKTKRRLFVGDPQNYLLMCNAELMKSEAEFCRYLNYCLAPHDVGQVAAVKFGNNILENIEFRRSLPRSGGPTVSIIMAAYNAANTVGYAIRSILAQEHGNIELLICDDASGDETMAAITREVVGDERVRIFRSEANQGTYNVRNALLAVAGGEYVTFHDADDFALPSRIRLQTAAMLARKPRAVIARHLRVRPSGEFVFYKDQSALRNAPVTIMAAKETFVRYGPYRSVRFGGDTELKERIRNAEGDRSVRQLKQPLMLGLWSEKSLTRNVGSEGLEDGYRGLARRRLSEVTVRQRLLGSEIVPEFEVVDALAKTGNILEPRPVVERSRP
jgi:hypothetical protein